MLRRTHWSAMLVIAAGALIASGLMGVLGALMPASSTPVAAQTQPEAARTITMVGDGMVSARPDQATIAVGVEVTRPSAREALTAANEATEQVLSTLDSQGIDRTNVQTSGLSLRPIYNDEQPRPAPAESAPPAGDQTVQQPAQPERSVTGYQATNQLTVRLDDLNRVGEVLDAVVTGGANQIGGVSFGIRDTTALRSQALQAAARDARVQAEAVAGAMNLSLGQVVMIRDASAGGPQPVRAEATLAQGGAVPIEPGQLTTHARVEVTFALTGGAPTPAAPTPAPTATPGQ